MEQYSHLLTTPDDLSNQSKSKMQYEDLEAVNIKELVKAFKTHELSLIALNRDRKVEKTRAKEQMSEKRIMTPEGDYQSTYGELTQGSLDNILNIMLVDNFKDDSSLLKLLPYRIHEESIFLDVGSGAG